MEEKCDFFEGEGTIEDRGLFEIRSRVCSRSIFEKGVSSSGRMKSWPSSSSGVGFCR